MFSRSCSILLIVENRCRLFSSKEREEDCRFTVYNHPLENAWIDWGKGWKYVLKVTYLMGTTGFRE